MSSVCVITRAVLKEHTEPVLTSFYLEKDKLTEVHPHLEGRSLLGNIYVGKVKHVVKNIDAAFVEIAGGQTCYLPFKEAQAPVLTNRRWDGRLLAGDEILVQVMRDALKTKEPALTAKISLEGRLAAAPKRDGRSFPGSAAKCNRSGWNDTGGADCGGGCCGYSPFTRGKRSSRKGAEAFKRRQKPDGLFHDFGGTPRLADRASLT